MSVHSQVAAEAIKCHVFVSQTEKRLADAGDAADAISNVKEMCGDHQGTLIELYDKVKVLAPNAAGAAYAKAGCFAECMMSQAPKAFASLPLPGAVAMITLKAQVPAQFAAATTMSDSISNFVGQQGHEFSEKMVSASGSLIGFLHKVAPDAMETAFKVAGLSVNAISEISEAASLVRGMVPDNLPGVSPEVLNVAASTAAVMAPGVFLAADGLAGSFRMTTEMAEAVADGAGTAASLGARLVENINFDAVVEGASAVGAAMGAAISSINADDVATVANVVMQALGTTAAVFPFLLPLQIAMRDIGSAAQQATYNKEAAQILMKRCADCSLLATEMASKVDKLSSDEAEKEAMFRPFIESIENCTVFLEKFTKKGFMRKMISWNNDGRKLSRLDKEVTDTLQNLSIRLDGKQIDLQAADSEKLDEIFEMMKKLTGGVSPKDPSSLDPEMLAEIAKKAGCESSVELKGELEDFGLKLDAIQKVLDIVGQKLQKIDDALQSIDSKLDEEWKAQREANDLLKAELLRQGAEQAQRHHTTLEAMKSLVGGGKNSVPVKFSTANQTEMLAKRANELVVRNGVQVICLHPMGIGIKCFEANDGEDGEAGNNGQSFGVGRSGKNGTNSMDGEDGEDGEDGQDGGDGTDGLNATDTKDFEVTIELLSEDVNRGTKEYRIEHSGPYGKDEQTVNIDIARTMFYVRAKGGNGGRGGNGGNGGNGGKGGKGGNGAPGAHKQDGGSGGSGGCGGNAGQGGMGGNGGNGSNGARVVIHTNHSAVLQLFAIDVSEGRGGSPGKHGDPGLGGVGGDGGNGGQPDTWTEYVGEGNHRASVTKHSRQGRQGKSGKKGKNGRPAPKKPSKTGLPGKPGEVSLCVYDDTGLCESGGTPFRMEIDKKSYPNLAPYPYIFNKEVAAGSDPLIYGQQVWFGPMLPVNSGSLYCPESSVVGRLTVHHKGSSTVGRTVVASFPKIPPENNTRNGELPPTAKQLLKLKIPTLAHSGFKLDGLSWPWSHQGTDGPRVSGKFKFEFNIAGITVQNSTEDVRCIGKYDVVLDVPVELVKNGTNCISAPKSLCLSDAETLVSYKIHNKLHCAPLLTSTTKCLLNIAGQGYRPTASYVLTEPVETCEVPVNPAEAGFKRFTIKSAAPALGPGETGELQYKLKLPKSTNEEPVLPGSVLILRSELYYEDALAQISPVTTIRLAAARPPPTNNTAFDVLFFTHSAMHVADYTALSQLCSVLGLRANFMDIEHYAVGGKLPPTCWAAQQGKVTIVHVPTTPEMATLVPIDALLEHVRLGGGLICGPHAGFQLNPKQSWIQYRRAIQASEGMTLLNLKNDMSINGNQISGTCLKTMTMNIISSMSTTTKLQFLMEKPNVCDIVVGSDLLEHFQNQVESGCCGCGAKVKIVPVQKTACTIKDCILASIRSELRLDIEIFGKSSNYSECVAIAALITFAQANVVGKASNVNVAKIGRDLFAVLNSSHILDDKLYVNKPTAKAWLAQRPTILGIANKCQSAAEAQHLQDGAALGERIKYLDIVDNVTARKSMFAFSQKTSLNINSTSKLYVAPML